MRSLFPAILLGSALLGLPAAAQEIAGSYTMATPTGGVSLVLERRAGEIVEGSLSGNGSTGTIRGSLAKDLLIGSVTFGGQSLYLRAFREGAQLRVEVAEFDAAGQPAWATARVLMFEPAAAKPQGAAPAAGSARNPFARKDARAGGDPLAGRFTGDGVVLQLEGREGRYTGRLETEDGVFPVELRGDAGRFEGVLQEDGEAFPFSGRMENGVLILESADGAFRLQPAGAGAPAGAAATMPDPRSEARTRRVAINQVALTDAQLGALEGSFGVRIADGDYWYDRACGAWGIQGGPMLGAIPAGLDLGGPLRADASGGGTGVFINGRELHLLDVQGLQRLGPVMPGRYWVDGAGYGGLEGGPALFNLVELARRAGGGGRGGPWSHHTKYGDGHVGGDGQGFSYYMDKDVSWSSGD